MKYCTTCGNQVNDDVKVCTSCGCILRNYDIDPILRDESFRPTSIGINYLRFWVVLLLAPIFFGLMMLLMLGNFILGIIIGTIWSLLFGSIMYIANRSLENKFAEKRANISKSKKIIVDGCAQTDGAGGWLFITSEGVEYYTHNLNFDDRSFSLCHSEIQLIGKENNKLVIVANNVKRTFKVTSIDIWLQKINAK